jgi:hypothetical protein
LAPRTNQKLEILAGAGTVTPILSKAVVERVNTKKGATIINVSCE